MIAGAKDRKKLMLSLIPLFLLFVVPLSAEKPFDLPDGTIITFPAQDDLNDFSCAGDSCGSPDIILEHFEKYVKKNAPGNYIKYDPYRISVKGGDNYLHVYSAKACRRLSKYVGANTFIMARVHLVSYKKDKDYSPYNCRYDVEVKVFSMVTGKEKVLFRSSDVPLDSLADLLKGKEVEFWQAIIEVSKN